MEQFENWAQIILDFVCVLSCIYIINDNLILRVDRHRCGPRKWLDIGRGPQNSEGCIGNHCSRFYFNPRETKFGLLLTHDKQSCVTLKSPIFDQNPVENFAKSTFFFFISSSNYQSFILCWAPVFTLDSILTLYRASNQKRSLRPERNFF